MSTLGNVYHNNNIGEQSKMYGVVDGIYYCNQERTNELSRRMAARNIPSAPLQPQYAVRPVATKYDMMSIVDRRPKSSVPLNSYPVYNIESTFNPGSAPSPWSGFASEIDDESRLRNEFFALQKCEQAEYVPSTKSDMYEVTVDSTNEAQPYPDLFQQQDFAPFNPNTCNTGKMFFENHTRQQIKDV
jgi:hypothetical protein